MKLKTLKDLTKFKDKSYSDEFAYLESDLKQEAIKWVKMCLETYSTWESLTPFIKFFNITEEDLE